MDFPAYVPAAVRAHITSMIGDSGEPDCWTESLAGAESRLAEIQEQFIACAARGEMDDLDGLRVELTKAKEHRDAIEAEIECLRRLAHDARMRDAYVTLTGEFISEDQWRSFISAAWAARMDYTRHRDKLKRAADLTASIADAADKLSGLLNGFSATGVNPPWEFFSVPDLLRVTDNREDRGRNLHRWRCMRRHILGDPPEPESSPDELNYDSPPVIDIVWVSPGDPVTPAPSGDLRNAWGAAPDFSALLGSVATAAREFQPSERGMIGAALTTRQHSIKTEYVRAFAHSLTENHGMPLTTSVMKAMASTATVVINAANDVVSYDDVRKALAKLGGDPLEKSRGN